MMKLMYFSTLLIVLLCASINIPGVMSGFWPGYIGFGFCMALFLFTLVFGIVKWKTL